LAWGPGGVLGNINTVPATTILRSELKFQSFYNRTDLNTNRLDVPLTRPYLPAPRPQLRANERIKLFRNNLKIFSVTGDQSPQPHFINTPHPREIPCSFAGGRGTNMASFSSGRGRYSRPIHSLTLDTAPLLTMGYGELKAYRATHYYTVPLAKEEVRDESARAALASWGDELKVRQPLQSSIFEGKHPPESSV